MFCFTKINQILSQSRIQKWTNDPTLIYMRLPDGAHGACGINTSAHNLVFNNGTTVKYVQCSKTDADIILSSSPYWVRIYHKVLYLNPENVSNVCIEIDDKKTLYIRWEINDKKYSIFISNGFSRISTDHINVIQTRLLNHVGLTKMKIVHNIEEIAKMAQDCVPTIGG